MKRIGTLIATLSLVSLLVAPTVLAQPRMGRGSGGWGWGGQYQRMYNPKTVETLTGEVVAIDTITPMRRMSGGVHLRVRSQNNREVSVHLGPAWYLDNQDVQIQVGDRIEIKGSRVTFLGQPTIIAARVRRGDRVLTLRDDNGFPVWSGWRRWQQSGSSGKEFSGFRDRP
ncbi:DNA-binding protein [Hydrococcus rivularis NIES-593]|uniref:DNA-binding protein n=1 Tax=Hydrococcus rivularis NIES-593 TaxID=1921803 RepID=A0A1U7H9Z8_9CYAN|nr:DNA-binding protein [Hydrococcus rivularis]OKH20409.1 DNA-binding protein [Hydrococcus rivularis NIES-593]